MNASCPLEARKYVLSAFVIRCILSKIFSEEIHLTVCIRGSGRCLSRRFFFLILISTVIMLTSMSKFIQRCVLAAEGKVTVFSTCSSCVFWLFAHTDTLLQQQQKGRMWWSWHVRNSVLFDLPPQPGCGPGPGRANWFGLRKTCQIDRELRWVMFSTRSLRCPLSARNKSSVRHSVQPARSVTLPGWIKNCLLLPSHLKRKISGSPCSIFITFIGIV